MNKTSIETLNQIPVHIESMSSQSIHDFIISTGWYVKQLTDYYGSPEISCEEIQQMCYNTLGVPLKAFIENFNNAINAYVGELGTGRRTEEEFFNTLQTNGVNYFKKEFENVKHMGMNAFRNEFYSNFRYNFPPEYINFVEDKIEEKMQESLNNILNESLSIYQNELSIASIGINNKESNFNNQYQNDVNNLIQFINVHQEFIKQNPDVLEGLQLCLRDAKTLEDQVKNNIPINSEQYARFRKYQYDFAIQFDLTKKKMSSEEVQQKSR